jgi:hypothetical protein
MHELAKLLTDEWPGHGVAGRDLGWFPLARLPLPSGRLWVGDPDFSWAELRSDDGFRAQLVAGDYDVSASVTAFGQANLVSGLRVCRTGIGDAKLGGDIGEVGTDSAAIGVGDAREVWNAFCAGFGDDTDAPVLFLERFEHRRCGLILPGGDSGAAIVYVNSGFGDGGSQARELLVDGARVGVEIQFIEPGTTA